MNVRNASLLGGPLGASIVAFACGGPAPAPEQTAVGPSLFVSGALSDSCLVDTDCLDGTCDRTVPGGYCTAPCAADADCADGFCVNDTCMAPCTSQRDCRSAEFNCFDVGDERGVCAFDLMRATPTDPNVGAPCRAAVECTAPLGLEAICIPESDATGAPTGFTEGLCSAVGCAADEDCGVDARCVSAAVRHCLPACTAGSAGRTGYACDADTGVWVPAASPAESIP